MTTTHGGDRRSGSRVTPLVYIDAPWVEQALCRETDPEAFYPDKGGSVREAKQVCARCLVRAECLTYALDNDERHGVWAGLSERERRRLKGQPDPDNEDLTGDDE